jgi:flavin-dependent dehydrogenase
MSAIESYDCVVIGGGPAGATAGALLAGFGHRVLILEKARFPRHHIGESLMPETYWTFKRLGVLDKLKASPFPKKESVQFVSASGKESQPFYFTDRNPHECSVTWQVNRDEFDRMMLDNAREHGAEVWENSLVKRVLFDGDRAVGVLIDREGSTVEVPAKVVIDASGQSAIIANQLKLRQGDSFLKNGAIYAYYKNAKRDEGRNSGATIIIHTPDRSGWFWFIPLPDDVASIGLVALPSYLFTGRGDDPMKTLKRNW